MSADKRKALYNQVQEMLERGVIVPSTSPYSSPPVLVEREGKPPRFCIDFRQINAITQDEAALLPKIPETLKDLGKARYFTSLDLASGYWQIPLEKESQKYTAFSTPDGAHYEFRVMPFGLKCASATFQKVMVREVLTGYLHDFVKVYLDDIIVYSNTAGDHAEHLKKVLERLRIHNLRVSPGKCHVGRSEIEFLGHQVLRDKTTPLLKHVEAVRNFLPPRNRRQLQSFLGTLNWIREYLEGAAELTRPLTLLLQKNVPFKWTQVHERAFDRIKQALSRPLGLHRPDMAAKFYLQTDASATGISAVLWQKGATGERNIVSYASSTLTPAERRYHINETEVLAAVFGCKKYREYLSDREFVLITDSQAMTWLNRNKNTKSKLMRWSLLLQEFSYTIRHTPGRENQLADFLSRNPDDTQHEAEPDNDRLLLPEAKENNKLSVLELHSFVDSVIRAQRTSPKIRRDIVKWNVIHLRGPRDRKDASFYECHRVEEDTLWRRHNDGDKLVLPARYVTRAISLAHDTAEAAHPGQAETLRELRRRFHHRNLPAKVATYVNNCVICAAVKSVNTGPKAKPKPRSPSSPFETISTDVLGPYPITPTGNQFILVTEDLFTKWVEAIPVREADAAAVCANLEQNIFARFGAPRTIISDNGGVYASETYARLCRKYEVDRQFTPVYHQQANSVERKVQDLKKVLSILMVHQRRKNTWDQRLDGALKVLRSRRNAATGVSPAVALLGYELPKRGDWATDVYRKERAVASRRRHARHRRVRAEQRRYNEKKYPEARGRHMEYREGDRVLVKTHKKHDNAFQPRWIGPLVVTRRISSEVYEVLRSGRRRPFYVNDMRPAPSGNDLARIESEEDSSSSGDSSTDEISSEEGQGVADEAETGSSSESSEVDEETSSEGGLEGRATSGRSNVGEVHPSPARPEMGRDSPTASPDAERSQSTTPVEPTAPPTASPTPDEITDMPGITQGIAPQRGDNDAQSTGIPSNLRDDESTDAELEPRAGTSKAPASEWFYPKNTKTTSAASARREVNRETVPPWRDKPRTSVSPKGGSKAFGSSGDRWLRLNQRHTDTRQPETRGSAGGDVRVEPPSTGTAPHPLRRRRRPARLVVVDDNVATTPPAAGDNQPDTQNNRNV